MRISRFGKYFPCQLHTDNSSVRAWLLLRSTLLSLFPPVVLPMILMEHARNMRRLALVFFDAGVAVWRNQIYLFAGTDTRVYDPSTDKWHNKARMISHRKGMTTAVLHNKI